MLRRQREGRQREAVGLLFPGAVVYLLLGVLFAAGRRGPFPLYVLLIAWPSALYILRFLLAGAWSPPGKRPGRTPPWAFSPG